MKAGVAVVLCALACAAAAAAAGPAVQLTSGGNTRAKAALLMLADLSEGWGATATKPTAPVLSCRGHAPSFDGLVEKGVASSPTFALTATGPFIVQQTSVYASAAQAAKVWQRAVTPALTSCAAQTLRGLLSHGIAVKVVARKRLRIATSAPHTVGYRLVATLTAQKQTLTDYFDVVYVSNGRTVSSVTFSSLRKPVPAYLEASVAKIVAARST